MKTQLSDKIMLCLCGAQNHNYLRQCVRNDRILIPSRLISRLISSKYWQNSSSIFQLVWSSEFHRKACSSGTSWRFHILKYHGV